MATAPLSCRYTTHPVQQPQPGSRNTSNVMPVRSVAWLDGCTVVSPLATLACCGEELVQPAATAIAPGLGVLPISSPPHATTVSRTWNVASGLRPLNFIRGWSAKAIVTSHSTGTALATKGQPKRGRVRAGDGCGDGAGSEAHGEVEGEGVDNARRRGSLRRCGRPGRHAFCARRRLPVRRARSAIVAVLSYILCDVSRARSIKATTRRQTGGDEGGQG